MEALAVLYQAPKDDATHLVQIERLARDLSAECRDILRDGRFRIGPAQKALNLFLKYLWCAGEIGPPPHCPFDYRIIQHLKLSTPTNWTDLDDSDTYKALVEAARAKAGPLSLPEWELQTYNTMSQTAIRAT